MSNRIFNRFSRFDFQLNRFQSLPESHVMKKKTCIDSKII